MANKETRVLKQDTLEILRQKTNEISLHVGDNEQLDALLADKTYSYTASAGQVLFDGADNNSKVTRFELSPQHTIDNTGGSIILEGVSSLDASYVANAIIYQGSSGSESWSATIVSASVNKIIVRDSTGTFSSSADLKVGTGSPDTIANANIARIIIESYPVAIARVYNNNTELTQGMAANGFFAPKIVGVSAISNSPSVGNSFSEGVTVYQNGSSLSTQGDIESDSNWYGVLHSVDSSEIRFKTSQGSFSATAKLRVLGSADEIAAADHGALTAVDSTYGSYIELTTPAANTNTIKVFSLDLVAAINELQDDIGTVENLTTSANDVVLAINEHDAELGTITALAMGTTASTVSSAIAEHETQIGNVDITDISSSNDTITGALEQIHDEIGDVTSGNLGTSASNLTAAVREHEDQIGNVNINSIASGNNTITGALDQLHTEIGSSSITDNLPNDYAYNVSDHTTAINTMSSFIGDSSIANIGSTDTVTGALQSLHGEIGTASFTNDLPSEHTYATGSQNLTGQIDGIAGFIGSDSLLTTHNTTLVGSINELETNLRGTDTDYVIDDNLHTEAALTRSNGLFEAFNDLTSFTGNTSIANIGTTDTLTGALQSLHSEIGNMVFGASGPVDAVNSTTLTGAINVLDAEIGNTNYNSMGTDISTALLNVYNDINTTNSLTTLQTTNKFIVGAINEIDADLFNAVGSERRTMSDLSTTDKTSIVDAINEIYADIHTAGSVTLDTQANYLVGAINEIEGVFDASQNEISAGSNAFTVTSGTFTVNSTANINLDTGNNHIVLKNTGTEFGRLTHNGGQLDLKSGSNQLFLSANNTNATFANNLTVTNNLIVNNDVDIEGNVDVNGSIETDGLSINGTTVTATATELNVIDGGTSATSTTIADADRVVVNDNGTMKQVAVTDLAAYFDDEITNMPNLVQSGALNSGSITSGFGSINIGTSTLNAGIITGTQFRIGNAQIVEAELETIDGVVAGTVGASKVVVVDANKDITGFRNITLSGELDAGSLDISGNVDTDGTLDVALGSTLRGAVSITNNTASSSSATGALTVAGGVGIGEDLYVAGDLYVEGTRTELNVTTLEVEDTLVLAGNDLSSEPTLGGFGLEVGPITSPSGVASGVTGAHSIVYNYATDRWEADGSLILSQATLGSPNIEGQAFESGDNLDFTASNGVSVTTSKSGTTHTVLYQNTDRGSSQSIFKNIVAGGVTISAESNNDTLTFTDDGVINALASGTTDDAIALSHADVFTGTAGNFGQVNAQDGQYIKSLTLTAEGHVSAITTGDFDTRYEASDPAWNLKVSGTQIDPVNNGDSVDFAVSSVDGVAGLTITSSTDNTDSVITLAHANTSSIGNLASNNSDGTVIQDLTLTYDTYGHALTRSVGTVNLDNRYIRSFVVEDGDGSEVTINQANEWKFVEGSGTGATIDINWTDITPGSDADPYDLTFTVNNTDRGSSQNIFKNIAVTDTDSGYSYAETGTVVADSNNDTVTFVSGGAIDIDVDATNDAIRISHSDTSSASSSNNSGRTYIQDITIDTYGHVTGIGTATETYSYTHPTYNGDDFSIDTGPLTGATVISDLDINVTTDSIGSVVDANGTVATRNLTLGDLGFAGWDVEVNGTHVADIGNNGDVDFKNGNHTTAVWTASGNRIQWNHNTFTSGGTTYGNNGTTVLSQVIVDGYGHTRAWQTTDLTSHFDDYSSWLLTADSGGTATIGSGNTVDIEGGTSISTVRSGNKVTVNFVDPGYLTSQRTATLTAVNSGADGNDPILRLSDGSNSDVRITDSGSVTVTYTNSGAINIHGTDNNTDVDVSVANLTSRLAQTSGTINIGDTSVSDNTIVIRGNLTVQGTQTTANAEVLQISDNKILLNYDYPNQSPTEDAFFEVERGSYVNSYIQWNENANRWQFAEGDTSMTLRNFSRAPDDANLTRFYIRPDDNSNIEITKDEVLAIDGGTAISTDFVTVNSGESHRLQINHENVTRNDPAAGSATLSYGNNFSAVTGVTSNAQGHITAVNTSQFTMPSAYSLPLASSATRGGIKVGYSENGKNYPVELASEKAYVNVPWTDTNTFRTVSVDTNGNGSVNNTLGASETLVLKKGSNISLSESGGIVTISSTDTNTVTRVKASNGTLQSGDITIAASGSASVSQSGNTITINATDTNTTYGVAAANTLGLIEVGYTTNSGARNYAVQLSGNDAYVNVPWTDTNTNTFRTVSVDTNGDGSVNNTLGATETLTFKKGSNITLSESGGVITISSTDTNTDTFLNDVSVVDNGANIILRHTMSNSTSHDIGITAGTGITLTEGTDTFAIASTTNLSFSRTSSALTVTSSNGNNVTLPAADANGPGLLTVGGHTLLSTIDTNANQNIAGNGISLTNSDKTINLDYDQRLPYSSGTHVKVGHSGTNGKSYLDFNVATQSGDSGYIDVYTSANGLSGELLNFKFEGDGDFHAANDIIAFSAATASDVKLKENIERVEGALEKVSQLDGVKFTWKKDGKESAGVIAQNVEEVLPSAVKEVETLDGEEINKHVDYNQLSALFIEAIKELKEENKLLRDEIENLKSINS
jgi:hypothetical protein